MNETKHTPGPWSRDCNPRHIMGGGHGICMVWGQFENGEADANADFIAAAPDMEIEIERLRAVNAQLLGALVTWRNWADDNPEVPNRLNGPVAAQVDAAIAAAEGGAK